MHLRPLVRASGLHAFLLHQGRCAAQHAPLTCSSASYSVLATQTAAPLPRMTYGGKLVRSQVALYTHPFRAVSAAASGNGANNNGMDCTARCT